METYMKTAETNMKIYRINAGASRVQKKIHNSLSLVTQGKIDQAAELFAQAGDELDTLKEEHASLRSSCRSAEYQMQEQNNSIGLMEVLRENIFHAGIMSSRRCGGVQFHVYS